MNNAAATQTQAMCSSEPHAHLEALWLLVKSIVYSTWKDIKEKESLSFISNTEVNSGEDA